MMKSYKLLAVFLMALMLASTVPAVSAVQNYYVTMHVNGTQIFFNGFSIGEPVEYYNPEYLELVKKDGVYKPWPENDKYHNIVFYKFKALKEGQTTLELRHIERNGCIRELIVDKIINITILP